MADTLKLTILSPERKLLEETVVGTVTLTTSEGEIEIHPGHAALIGMLEPGSFRYRTVAGESHDGFISTGFFQVLDGAVSVMAEVVEWSHEIDRKRALDAQTKAEEELKNPALEPAQFKKYQLKLQRALIRQGISSRI